LRYKAELVYEINRLKREKNAVILGHNYMEPALYHTVPDHVGDSLELSRVAARTEADIIVFCGVRFMAETAKILSPEKTVLLPAREAGCSLAASITAEDVRDLRWLHPGVPVVTYVNTYAEVKAESDACCTSSNAAAVVASFAADTVIFLPDEFMAGNIARETGKRVIFPATRGRAAADGARKLDAAGANGSGGSAGGTLGCAVTNGHDKSGTSGTNGTNGTIIGWPGRCEVHEKFTPDDVRAVRRQFPDVVVLAHPECSPETIAEVDFSGSTSAMVRYVRETEAPRYLLLTECSMADNIIAENPEKEMVRLCSVRCPHMNEITLEDTLESLRQGRYAIEVPEDIRVPARRAIDYMLAIAPTASSA
jgi:quinolinate synthase